jgi:predicted transcriptional regulator
MDILYRRGESTVADIMAELPDPPTYSAVRSVLRILAQKDLVLHKEDGPRYVYLPAQPTERARDAALEHLVETYFAGSAEQAVTALLKLSDSDLTERELKAIRSALSRARESGR